MSARRLSAAVIVLLGGTTLLGPSIVNAPADATDQLATAPVAAAAATGNPATPGNFTGRAFDQCTAPSQHAMDAWRHSPYDAVGIYISGESRYCGQRNLTARWVSTQLAHGWKLLPITVGPQAACNHRAHHRISAKAAGGYRTARGQARAEANGAVRAAHRLGLSAGTTIFYDLEAFSTSSAACRNSSLAFLASWTEQLNSQGYVAGVYSSASSGIRLLGHVRRAGTSLTLPQQVWVADWNGHADTRTAYLASDAWRDGRVKQYRGSHTERHGGVAINIDSNYVDLRVSGPSARSSARKAARSASRATTHRSATTKRSSARASATKARASEARAAKARAAKARAAKARAAAHRALYLPGRGTPEAAAAVVDGRCKTGRINLASYPATGNGTRSWMHPVVQCLLKQNGLYNSYVAGYWDKRTAYGVHKLQARTGHDVKTKLNHADWVSLLVAGNHRPRLTHNVRGADVVRLQRALHAAGLASVHINGIYDHATAKAVRHYQRRVGVPATGVVGRTTWRYLEKGHL